MPKLRPHQGCLPALLTALLLLQVPGTASALMLSPVGDTYITEHTGLGGPTSNHNLDPSMVAVGSATFLAYPLLRFDLTPYAGLTVYGNVTLHLFGDSFFGLSSTRAVSVLPVLIPWDSGTVTYNTFGGAPGVQFGSDVGLALDTRAVGGAGISPQYFTWTLPGSLVQGWIDNPAQNHGLLVNNQNTTTSQDLAFDSLEGANAPILDLTLIPEMNTRMLFVLAAASALLGLRQRVRGQAGQRDTSG